MAAPLRSVEEIRNQIGHTESVMEREQIGFRVATGSSCMVCNKTYEGSHEMLITMLKHTNCKICIASKLQTDDANEFIIGSMSGSSWRSSNGDYKGLETSYEDSKNVARTDSLESSDEVRGLPRGYVYPNSKFMEHAEEGTRNKKMPYSSLRMNSESKSSQKATGNNNMKGTSAAALRMNAKPLNRSGRKKQKAESRKRLWPICIISEAASNELTLLSTGRKNICDEDWLHEKGRGELLNEISDDDDDRSESEVNKP